MKGDQNLFFQWKISMAILNRIKIIKKGLAVGGCYILYLYTRMILAAIAAADVVL